MIAKLSLRIKSGRTKQRAHFAVLVPMRQTTNEGQSKCKVFIVYLFAVFIHFSFRNWIALLFLLDIYIEKVIKM